MIEEAVGEELISHKQTYSVNDAIESVGFGRFQMYMLITCSLCWLVGSITFESITWLIESLEANEQYNLGIDERGLLAMATPLGILLGSPFMGVWSDLFGRSKLVVLALAATTGAFIIQAVSPRFD